MKWGLALFVSLVAQAQNLEAGGKVFSLPDLISKIPVVHVKLDDPNYLAQKEFDGFELSEILKIAGIESADEIAFTTLDGFTPSIEFSRLKDHRGIVVFKERGGPLLPMKKGKGEMSAAPFYLVWEEGAKSKFDLPWPYQLAKIEAIDWKKKYALIIPRSATAPQTRGFVLFKANCLACHSVNLQGGEVGPELNVPRNVTEYWKPKELRAFIRDASSFRAKSKMTRFPHFTDSQIEDLVAYLSAMAKFKSMPQALPQ